MGLVRLSLIQLSLTGWKVNGVHRSNSAPRPLKSAVIGADKMVAIRGASPTDGQVELGELRGRAHSDTAAGGQGNRNSHSPHIRAQREESPNWPSDTSDSVSVGAGSEGEMAAGIDSRPPQHSSLQQNTLANILTTDAKLYGLRFPPQDSNALDNVSLSSGDSTRITRHSRRAWMRWTNIAPPTTPASSSSVVVPPVELEISLPSPSHQGATLPWQQHKPSPAATSGSSLLLPPHFPTPTTSTLSPLTHNTHHYHHHHHQHTRHPSPPGTYTPEGGSTRGASPCSIGDDSVFASSPSPQKRLNLPPSVAPVSLLHPRSSSMEAIHPADLGSSLRRDSQRLLSAREWGNDSCTAVVCINM